MRLYGLGCNQLGRMSGFNMCKGGEKNVLVRGYLSSWGEVGMHASFSRKGWKERYSIVACSCSYKL